MVSSHYNVNVQEQHFHTRPLKASDGLLNRPENPQLPIPWDSTNLEFDLEGTVIGVSSNLTLLADFSYLGTRDGAVQSPSTGRPEVAWLLDPRYSSSNVSHQ